jgi:hypothetical protein
VDEALAQALALELAGAVVAERHVAAAAEGAVGGEAAAGAADLGVVAGLAEAPQLVEGAVAGERDDVAVLPDLLQGELADVAAVVGGGREGGAALDGAVGLDAHDELAGAAALPVRLAGAGAGAEELLVRAEVADVVAEAHVEGALLRDAAPLGLGERLLLDLREGVDHLEDHPGLEDPLGHVGGAAHRRGQLGPPHGDAGVAQGGGGLLEVVLVEPVDLAIAGDDQAGGPRVGDARERRGVAAGGGAQLVVDRRRAVDRHADRGEAGLLQLLAAVLGEAAAAGLHGHADAAVAQVGDQAVAVAAQVGLAADQGDLAGAEFN